MIFTPQTFPIVILIIIPRVSEFIVTLTVILHTTYLIRQEVDQTFSQTWQRFLLYFLNPTQSLSHWINFSSY